MCNCGRTRNVVTSAQLSADDAVRQAQDAEAQLEIMRASAANAVANTGASHGWYVVGEDPQ